VASSNLGAILPWSPGVTGSNVAGLGRLGEQVVIAGSLPKPNDFPRAGIDLLPMPTSDFLFHDGFEQGG